MPLPDFILVRVSISLQFEHQDDTHTSARRELMLSAVFFAFLVGAIVVFVDCGIS